MKLCFSDPIPEIFQAARVLDEAVSAHLRGEHKLCSELILLADNPKIGEWTNSLWGPGGPFSRPMKVPLPLPYVEKSERLLPRMPNSALKKSLLARDGFQCRFCGIPVIREEIRTKIKKIYPETLRWRRKNADQHFAFQAMWVQYDHLIPHARGGANKLENMAITCAGCNYGRCDLTLEEAGLKDPRSHIRAKLDWDGLERFR